MVTYKRGSIWYYDFMIRRRRYRGAIPEARTRAQAERVETQKREEVYNGRYGAETRQPMTLRAFVEEKYLPIARETTRYFSANAGYETRVICEEFGARPLAEISEFEISKWLISLKPDYAGTTINHFIKRLNVIFNRAIAAGHVEAGKNPMTDISKVEEIPLRKQRLSPEREAAILEACAALGFDYVAQAVIILLDTGMRPTELFKMRREQVWLNRGVIEPISYKRGRRNQSAQPKKRAVPLTERARAEFERLLAQAEGEQIYPYGDIKKSWERARELAAKETNDPELAGFWLRWCRDEAENRWREAGMHPLDIAYLMGHSSPKTTMIYNNPRLENLLSQMSAANVVASLSQTEKGNLIRLPVNG